MADLKDRAEDVAEKVTEEIETLAHNTAHPEDETDKQADKRQPWMPIAGLTIVAIILFAVLTYFFK